MTRPVYVDEIAVERRCAGDRTVGLNRAEAAAAWMALERRRLSSAEVAERLGVAQRTVVRWRAGVAPSSLRGTSGSGVGPQGNSRLKDGHDPETCPVAVPAPLPETLR